MMRAPIVIDKEALQAFETVIRMTKNKRAALLFLVELLIISNIYS